MRELYELLLECAGPPNFCQRGASFQLSGKVLARLELRGCPRAIAETDDDVLWVSLEEPATKNLPAATVKKLKDVVLPLAAYGTVNASIALNSVPKKKLDQVLGILSECFSPPKAEMDAINTAPTRGLVERKHDSRRKE